jgi:hypothetical protein
VLTVREPLSQLGWHFDKRRQLGAVVGIPLSVSLPRSEAPVYGRRSYANALLVQSMARQLLASSRRTSEEAAQEAATE